MMFVYCNNEDNYSHDLTQPDNSTYMSFEKPLMAEITFCV